MPWIGDQHSEVPSLNSGRDTWFSDFILFLYVIIFQNCGIVSYVVQSLGRRALSESKMLSLSSARYQVIRGLRFHLALLINTFIPRCRLKTLHMLEHNRHCSSHSLPIISNNYEIPHSRPRRKRELLTLIFKVLWDVTLCQWGGSSRCFEVE